MHFLHITVCCFILSLTCNLRLLQSSYTTPITKLSEPIDVYSDWIDACEAENS
jgi:transcription elongation factor Elf1